MNNTDKEFIDYLKEQIESCNDMQFLAVAKTALTEALNKFKQLKQNG